MENTLAQPLVPTEHPSGKEPELPTYSEDGVDLSLIRWMLSLTPLERIRFAQNHANAVQRLRNAKRVPLLRPFRYPEDAALLIGLDTAFTTERIYRLVQNDFSLELVDEAVQPPLQKCYPLDPSNPEEREVWDYAVLAENAGKLVGFAAAQYVAWNRRVVLWHLYVAPQYRHQGVGTQLLEAVGTYAREVDARCVWLETQNINYPAIQLYLRAGFTFCGVDTTLYDPADVPQNEVALFFARPVASI